MPCTKCKEGKYKLGKTGSCEYDTKEECEKANKDYYKKNNTTMKQYPTPLGKTYEEYEKELKEYNLSSQKIELGIVDDLEEINKQFFKQLDVTTAPFEKVFGTLKTVISSSKKTIALGEKYLKLEKELLKATKELGLKPPKTYGKNKEQDMNSLKGLEKIINNFIQKANAV